MDIFMETHPFIKIMGKAKANIEDTLKTRG